MQIYALQYTDMSYSISTDDEFIDTIEQAFMTEEALDKYIEENGILLGKRHLYDNNYECHTKVVIDVEGGN